MARNLIILRNDLESERIVRLCTAAGWDVRAIDRPWGHSIALSDIEDLLDADAPAREIVLAEVPNPALEARLQGAGHVLRIVDHHLYIDGRGDRDDRRRETSSLEQIAALYPDDITLDPVSRMIAANDRGYWPALLAEGLAQGQSPSRVIARARALRNLDLARRVQAAPDGSAVTALRRARTLLRACQHQIAQAFARRADPDAPPGGAVRLNVLGTGRADAAHPELIVARVDQRFAAVFMDALYLCHLDGLAGAETRFGQGDVRGDGRDLSDLAEHPLEALVLFVDENDQPVQLEYSGPGRRRVLLDQFMARLSDEGGDACRLRLWSGGTRRSCYLGADPGLAAPGTLTSVADALADALLEGNRPLERWASTFMQVLSLADGAAPVRREAADRTEPEIAGPAERNYLHRTLRDLLAPLDVPEAGPIPRDYVIRTYALRQASPRLSISVRHYAADKIVREVSVPISLARLHIAPERRLIAEWMAEGGAPWCGGDTGGLFDRLIRHAHLRAVAAREKPKTGWWHEPRDPYPTLPPGREWTDDIDTLADLMDFNHFGREVFGGYFAGGRVELRLVDEEDHVLGEPITLRAGTQDNAHRPVGWFRALLAQLLTDFNIEPEDVSLQFDERSFTVTTVTGMGQAPVVPAAVEMQRMLLGRLATVEDFGPRYFYDQDFARAELERALYKRFETSETYPGDQSLYAITDQSLVHWGHGWFAREIASKHTLCQYKRIYLSNVVSSAVFHGLSERLSRLYLERCQVQETFDGSSGRIADEFEYERALVRISEQITAVKAAAIAYVNALWYTDVSTHMQGRELSRKIAAQMPVTDHYDELMAELERAGEQEIADQAEMAERRRTRLTIVTGLIGSLFTVVPLGQAWIVDPVRKWLEAQPWEGAGAAPVVAAWAVVAICALLVPVILVKILERRTFREAGRSLWRTLWRIVY